MTASSAPPETPTELSQLVCLEDYARAASDRLEAGVQAYLLGGAGDELSLRRGREAFDRLHIVPRVLRRPRPGAGGTRLTLLGVPLAHPILVAPIAYQRLAHPAGELATAIAAGAQQSLMVLSCQSSTAMEEVYAAAPACRWFQLYFQRHRDATLALVRRAERAGFQTLVVTVDAPLSGVRNREQRSGFRLPAGIAAVNLEGLPSAPAIGLEEAASVILDGLMAAAPDWDDIAWLRSLTGLPIVLKGILAPEDAVTAVELGIAAIIVSNHGGRTLDTAISPIDALPAIAARIDDRVPLLLDGGIRRGTDVLKALALGARAVLLGRPVVAALAVSGALGVSHVLRILRDEFEVAMALTGCTCLDEIGPHLVAGWDAIHR